MLHRSTDDEGWIPDWGDNSFVAAEEELRRARFLLDLAVQDPKATISALERLRRKVKAWETFIASYDYKKGLPNG